MNIIILFVEITEYNLARIRNVYRKFEEHSFSYVYGSSSKTGHQSSSVVPKDSVVLSGKEFDKIGQLKNLLIKIRFDFAIINGYTGVVNAWLINYCRKHDIPYAIESDTQLCIPKNPAKRWIKHLYLHRIFRGNAYGFPGGTRQIKLFRHYGMPDDHVFLMPMTVDTEQFREISERHSKAEYKASLGLSGKKMILYAGRFAPEKDIPCLLRAAELLHRGHDDFVVCLIGKGESKAELERMTETLGLLDCVRFYDYQLMPKLAEYYSAADVFVLPSSFEPWGLVVNEALACRVPVIASDACGCVDDLIVPGQNGDVFSAGDAEALSDKLGKVLFGSNSIIRTDIISTWNYHYYLDQLKTALETIENDQDQIQ